MRKNYPFFFIITFCCLLALPQDVLAADTRINTEGAVKLQKLVQDNFKKFADERMLKTGEKLSMNGEISVTPKNDFYEIRIPGLLLSVALQRKLDIGTLVANVAPTKQEGEWVMSLAVPPSMGIYNDKRYLMTAISIGKQRFTGLWKPASEEPLKFDAAYEDIHIVNAEGLVPVYAVIGALKASVNLKNNGNGTWSVPAGVSDIVDVSADQISVQTGGRGNAGGPFRIGFDKISFQNTTKETGGPDKVENASIVKIDGIKVPLLSPALRGIAPDAVNLNLTFHNLPWKKLIKLTETFTTGPVCTPVDPEHALACNPPPSEEEINKVTEAVSKAMSENRTSLSIRDTSIRSRDIEMAFTGDFSVQPKTAANVPTAGATGKLALAVTGLGEAIQAVQEAGKTTGDMTAIPVSNILTFLRVAGEPGKSADGKTTTNYTLHITPEGQMLLNSVDIKAVMGLAAGVAAPASAPPAAVSPAPAKKPSP